MKKWDRFQLDKVPADLGRTITNRLGVNWQPKHFITSRHCKVCRCPARCEIEELLYVGVSYDDISSWLKHIGYPAISPTDVSKHYKAHCNVQKEVEERAVARYVSEVRKREAMAIAEVAKEHTGEDVVDGIINLFAKRELKPDDIKVDEALKAAKIQQHSGHVGAKDPFVQVYIQSQQINVGGNGEEPAIEGEVEED